MDIYIYFRSTSAVRRVQLGSISSAGMFSRLILVGAVLRANSFPTESMVCSPHFCYRHWRLCEAAFLQHSDHSSYCYHYRN